MEPWKTDKWYVSPWCYLPEVRKNDHFAQKIKIHDVTLRDGEQQTAVVFRREEKVAIAKKLDALGVHRIEAGMPAVSDAGQGGHLRHRRARPEGGDLRRSPAAFPKRSRSSRTAAARGSSSRSRPATT